MRRPELDERDSARALVVWAVGVAAAAVVLGAGLWAIRGVLVLIYVCALLAVGLSPLVRWIERRELLAWRGRRPPRWAVILVLYALVLTAVTGIALVVVPPLIAQAQELIARAPQLLDRAQGFCDRHHLGSLDLRTVLPTRPSGAVAGTLLGTVTGILGGFFGVVTIVILTFYFLVEGDTLQDRWLRLLPRDRRAKARAIAGRVTGKVSAWLVGQLILSAVIGTTAGLALALLGVPFPYVLAIIAAIGELVPYAGPFISGVIASGIAAVSVSWNVAFATAAYYLVQQLVENNVLQPKLMGHQVGLSAATVIIAVLVGGSLLGIVGAVLAVPTAAILQATLEELAPEER